MWQRDALAAEDGDPERSTVFSAWGRGAGGSNSRARVCRLSSPAGRKGITERGQAVCVCPETRQVQGDQGRAGAQV